MARFTDFEKLLPDMPGRCTYLVQVYWYIGSDAILIHQGFVITLEKHQYIPPAAVDDIVKHMGHLFNYYRIVPVFGKQGRYINGNGEPVIFRECKAECYFLYLPVDGQ